MNPPNSRVAHLLGPGDRVVLEATFGEARSRGEVVVGAERHDQDVGVVRAAVGRHVPGGRVDRGHALLPELDTRLREQAIGDLNLHAVRAPEQDVELREAEREAVVLVDQRDANLVCDRVGETARELQPAEPGTEDDDVFHAGVS